MKERYTKRNEFVVSDVEYFESLGFSSTQAELLSCKGVTEANFDSFKNKESRFHDPSEMENLLEAADTLSYVIESGGSVLICGDYDADGLTSSAILSLFLRDNGVDNDVIVPTREEGYGLHFESVAKAFENKYYDLVITVDCGISNAKEIDLILQNFDTEVIVTDHHELPDVLPNCLCVNPKMGYPFPFLAGAGVAWKLVEAVAGRETALLYAPLAALGTVADIMPLEDENVSIVLNGLDYGGHKSLLRLAELTKAIPLTSVDVAMKIAPKINAASRVGNPYPALKVLLARDKCDVDAITELMQLNDERKVLSDKMYDEAKKLVDYKSVRNDLMTFLYSDDWKCGMLGIIASRLREEYNLPSVVMTLDGENYIGSARSVDKINLFNAFQSVSNLLVKFGGHKSSVGFTVSKDNLTLLKNGLTKYFASCDENCFDCTPLYDVELSSKDNVNDVYSLTESFQPMLPQDKPIFRVRGNVRFANLFGKENNHLSITIDSGFELKGFFNFSQYCPYLQNAEIDVLCSLEYDSYNKSVYGLITNLALDNSLSFDELYKQNLLRNVKAEKIEKFVDSSVLSSSSVLAVFDDYATFCTASKQYDFSDFALDFFLPSSTNKKVVVIAPITNYPFAKFDNVVIFSGFGLNYFVGNAVYVATDSAEKVSIEMNRDVCALTYTALKNKGKFDSVKGVYDKYLLGKISYTQFVASIKVLEELGLVKIIDKYTVDLPKTDKISLEESFLYNYLR